MHDDIMPDVLAYRFGFETVPSFAQDKNTILLIAKNFQPLALTSDGDHLFLALDMITYVQMEGGFACLIDLGKDFDPEYAHKVAQVDVGTLIISQPDNPEQALEVLQMMVREGAFDLIVLNRKEILEGFLNSSEDLHRMMNLGDMTNLLVLP